MNSHDERIDLKDQIISEKTTTKYIYEMANPTASSKRVLVIYTGGTLGMRPREEDGALVPCKGYLQQLLSSQYEFQQTDRLPSITIEEWEPLLDSSDIHPDDWERLAAQITANYWDYEGFVVIHGTDTLAYTASALSFMLENLSKPIILTGAQIPIAAIYNDAKRNLLASILLAAQIQAAEVLVCFGNKLFRGNRVTKMDNWGQHAFSSPNYPEIAELGVRVQLHPEHLRPFPRFRFRCRPALFRKIFVLHLVPGFDDGVLDMYKERGEEARALVLLLYGAGNAPNRKEGFLNTLVQAKQRNVEIVVASQCRFGSVDMSAYGTGRALLELGVINARDMTVEATVTKLAYLMGLGLRGVRLKTLMEENLRGELSHACDSVPYVLAPYTGPPRASL